MHETATAKPLQSDGDGQASSEWRLRRRRPTIVIGELARTRRSKLAPETRSLTFGTVTITYEIL
jgi:hypothetical protein